MVLSVCSTGCLFNVSKVICLWKSLKIQNMSSDWCFHFAEIGPFWDLVSKKSHNHSVIIHLWRLRRCIIAKISKIHWKLIAIKHARTRLQLNCAHLCTNLYEIWNIIPQDSNWPPHKISWRSELLLRRYLQNNTGVF